MSENPTGNSSDNSNNNKEKYSPSETLKKIELIRQAGSLDSEMELLRLLKQNQIDQKEYYLFWKIYKTEKSRRKGIPVSGKFELTPLCNLDCRMCYVHRDKTLPPPELLSVSQWKSIMQQAIDAGMIEASLTGGECLTYPGFDELYLFLFHQGISLNIYTNGILLTPERIAFFQKYPPFGIQISLYGSSDDGYEKVTGYRLFEKVHQNISKALETGLPVSLAITPSRFMRGDIKKTIQTAYQLTRLVSLNSGLFECRETSGHQGDDNDLTLAEYIDLFKYEAALNSRQITPPAEQEIHSLTIGGNSHPSQGVRCGAGRNGFYITSEGKMLSCAMIQEPSCDPLRTDFAECWKTLQTWSRNAPYPGECHGCDFNGICTVCLALHNADGIEGHAHPAICSKAVEMYKAGLWDRIDRHSDLPR